VTYTTDSDSATEGTGRTVRLSEELVTEEEDRGGAEISLDCGVDISMHEEDPLQSSGT
jgi:hypothetical protein